MEVLDLGKRREVCWDEALMDRCENVRVEMHKPKFANVALECDAPWEGTVCGYFTIIRDGLTNRMYYRGAQLMQDEDGGILPSHPTFFCYAESRDGKHFERKNVGTVLFNGSTDNNIIRDDVRDNMFFFRDTNPDCPKDELFKGLAEHEEALWYFKSSDGVHFERVRVLADDGAYDSLNVCFWDPLRKKYFLYYRGVHGGNSIDGKWNEGAGPERHNSLIRDVRVRTSVDFVSWDEPSMIEFEPERDDVELYTNQIMPYYRAPHMFIGFPTRYTDRYGDPESFPDLPDAAHRNRQIEKWGRTGTAMTDSLIMTTRDGKHFRRTEECFLSAGPENGVNWYYGDGYICYGMLQTKSDYPGEPDEISIYCGRAYRVEPLHLCRFTVRLDGFFSWRGDYEGGKVLTKPFTFEGNELSVNFSTSGATWIRIKMTDENGTPIEGFDSGRIFGDSVDRRVRFAGDLAELSGKPARMEIELKDADLYSFRFDQKAFSLL